ncbi:MAG: hypothetical protein ACI8ZM_002454 [Crocinitomix sp.]|jgi:hypothetical protein
MKKGIIICFVLTSLFACKKDPVDNSINYGYEYFPIEIGHYTVYDVVDIFHDLEIETAHDTNRFQIKELIAEVLVDGEGDTIQKLKRYIRADETEPWTIQDIWTQKRTASTGEVVDENDRQIKMVFAIAYNRTWDCNALNNEPSLECYYENIYEPYTVSGVTYDSTVIVEKENFTSFIDFKRNYTVYARNVGRIKSVFKNLEIDNSDSTDIQKGSEIYFDLIEYGTE